MKLWNVNVENGKVVWFNQIASILAHIKNILVSNLNRILLDAMRV